MMMMNVMIVITVLILIMIMIRNLMIMITMMTMITMMMAKSPLQGHGKQGENGDAHGEAGREGVEAARSFFKSY